MPTWKDLKSIINAWKTELGSYVKTSTLKAKLDGYATKKELDNYATKSDVTKTIDKKLSAIGVAEGSEF